MTSNVNGMDIKYEDNTSTPDVDAEYYSEFNPMSNIPHIDSKAEENTLNEFYLDLLKCERGCATCQKYMKILSKHVRDTHIPLQPIQDPLLIVIDALDIDRDPVVPVPHAEHFFHLSSIQIKSEVDEDIEKIDCSEEESETGSDPDFDPSVKSTRLKECRVEEELHTGENLFKCYVCEKSFKRKYLLTDHKRIHTGDKPFNCDVCDKSFRLGVGLSNHKLTHTGERPHKCIQCEKCFSKAYYLTLHMRIHTGERPYKCDQCEKTFSQKCSLNVHKKIHTGKKPFKCDQCGKSFALKNNLIQHTRTHTGEKRFKCDQCEKSFSASCSLNTHKLLHTGEKPHKCEQCEKSFTQKCNLIDHIRAHTGEKRKKVGPM